MVLTEQTQTDRPPPVPPTGGPSWSERILVREMWAAVAIAFMWLAVLFDGVYGSNLTSYGNGAATTVPTGPMVAFFALLGTGAVAHYGFRRGGRDR